MPESSTRQSTVTSDSTGSTSHIHFCLPAFFRISQQMLAITSIPAAIIMAGSILLLAFTVVLHPANAAISP